MRTVIINDVKYEVCRPFTIVDDEDGLRFVPDEPFVARSVDELIRLGWIVPVNGEQRGETMDQNELANKMETALRERMDEWLPDAARPYGSPTAARICAEVVKENLPELAWLTRVGWMNKESRVMVTWTPERQGEWFQVFARKEDVMPKDDLPVTLCGLTHFKGERCSTPDCSWNVNTP